MIPDLRATKSLDLESDVACIQQPLTMKLEELGAYPPPPLLPHPQLLGSFDESEDSTSALLTNLTHNFRTTQIIHF